MMKRLGILMIAGLMATPAIAEEIDAETVGKIEAYLASIECQMDPDDIEVEDDGYDLDDVICKGGNQFDIKLDVTAHPIYKSLKLHNSFKANRSDKIPHSP